eukprot:jgi/Mesvir1/6857/Mv09028-RA.1
MAGEDVSVYDVCVIGVGAMGSAACSHLASRGLSVLGLEQFDIPNARGSSHGHTRIIRLAYFESPAYTPLAKRSIQLWRELEEATGQQGQLLHTTGALDIGPPHSVVFSQAHASCLQHGLPHEVLDGKQVRERWPALSGMPDGYMACFQGDGGMLAVEACVRAHADNARRLGAHIHSNEEVLSYRHVGASADASDAGGTSDNALIQVTTNRGVYRCRHLCLTAGPWTAAGGVCLVPELAPLLQVERQVVGWFAPVEEEQGWKITPQHLPVFIIQDDDAREWYGLPQFNVPGLKVGLFSHKQETVGDPSSVAPPCQGDADLLRGVLQRFLPCANGAALDLSTCMFTYSPDHHFIVDKLPCPTGNVTVGCGFSGHGFKFAPVIGEMLADLIQGVPSAPEVQAAYSLFALSRLTSLQRDETGGVKNVHQL